MSFPLADLAVNSALRIIRHVWQANLQLPDILDVSLRLRL